MEVSWCRFFLTVHTPHAVPQLPGQSHTPWGPPVQGSGSMRGLKKKLHPMAHNHGQIWRLYD